MFSRILIANRGEIACRVIKTARRLGISTVAVYSEADAGALHVSMADLAVAIGPAAARESYLVPEAIIEAARATGAEAIHPGYGFLSENADFAEAVAAAGLVFIGPPADAIRAMGLKDGAKRLMEKAGVPVVPGYHGADQDPDLLAKEADRIGYPVLIKAVAGGGGKGMRRVDSAKDFETALNGARREAKAAFGDDRVLVEKFVTQPRHVEIQVFADGHGNVVSLFERDCSLQRRHQKVVEEAPAPGMTPEVRQAMSEAATEAARAIGYRGAGTVEFIADGSNGLTADGFYFMEMNTRLQVEHPVTEGITGLDLVEWQLRVAAGEPLPAAQAQLGIAGHAVEVRVYAENPARKFLPATGTLHHLSFPEDGRHIRVDTGVRQGDAVSVHYDPMIAKLIAWDTTREGALRHLDRALAQTRIAGVTTNAAFLRAIVCNDTFRSGAVDTGFIDRHLDSLVGDAGEVPDEVLMMGAVDLLLPERSQSTGGEAQSPWAARDGWRVGARARARLVVGGPDQEPVHVQYTEDGWDLTIGERTVAATACRGSDGEIVATLNGRVTGAHVLRRPGMLSVMMNGATYDLALADPLAHAGGEGDGESRITAPMPGKILAVHAKPGQGVARGEALVVLEAMKMEHTLTAGRDSTVEAVNVAVGDQVDEGAVVVTLASEE